MKKHVYKICIFLLTICSLFTFVGVNASSGYTYDHKGNVISSTEGFTVNETPYIYNSMGLTEERSTFPASNI